MHDHAFAARNLTGHECFHGAARNWLHELVFVQELHRSGQPLLRTQGPQDLPGKDVARSGEHCPAELPAASGTELKARPGACPAGRRSLHPPFLTVK